MNRLYRFESVRPLCNGIFEARDPLSGSSVWILQWTPDPEIREACGKALESRGKIDFAEVFSDNYSFYLAADSLARAREAAARLLREGLFSGSWPTPFDTPPPLPVSAARRQPLVGAGWRTVSIALAGLCVGLSILAGTLLDDRQSLTARLEHTAGALNADAKKLSVERDEANAARDELRRDLEAAQSAHESREILAAKIIGQMYDALPGGGGHATPVQLSNSCSDTDLDAAVTFPGVDGGWVTKGWFRVKRGETLDVGQFPSGSAVYLMAKAEGRLWDGASTADAKEIDIVDNDFTHPENQPIFGKNQRKAKAFREAASYSGVVAHTFECVPAGSNPR